jgi:hypothetical protein
MKFDPETGTLEVADLVLSRHANVPNLVEKSRLKWEDWSYGKMGGFRAIFDMQYANGKKVEVIFIINFRKENGEIFRWKIGPSNLISNETWGTKKRLIKANREWFEKETGVKLPVRKNWGEVDAFFDPHNLTAIATCLYREFLDDGKPSDAEIQEQLKQKMEANARTKENVASLIAAYPYINEDALLSPDKNVRYFCDEAMLSFGYRHVENNKIVTELALCKKSLQGEEIMDTILIRIKDVKEIFCKMDFKFGKRLLSGMKIIEENGLWCVNIDGGYSDPESFDTVRKYGTFYVIGEFIEWCKLDECS